MHNWQCIVGKRIRTWVFGSSSGCSLLSWPAFVLRSLFVQSHMIMANTIETQDSCNSFDSEYGRATEHDFDLFSSLFALFVVEWDVREELKEKSRNLCFCPLVIQSLTFELSRRRFFSVPSFC